MIDVGCELCGWERDGSSPIGKWVFRNRLWSVLVLPGYEVPGWVVLQLRRHAVGPSAMNEEEAVSMGPLVVAITGAIGDVLPRSKVYLAAFGEMYPHFHMLFAVRGPDVPSALRGPALISGRAALIDIPAALGVAAEVGARLVRVHEESLR